ncbi:hypothetical protein [Clostridium butyricum]|uniref:Uncharacterized protein n=1 Tax=Clostridium butyricum E4 str. BoNT E BL5262 TaxID=632245 RepID=C4IDL9_CLOBU|nr:hypothetical protein [Clostridium butyricum]EDT75287.1 hypothetical protein CBY_3589 [Clostridium butyricum 5521]EEP55526.1 hypothetical protein CLP_3449 [Clostridium butyricum E4 str. BoNT E BL5262]
MINEADKGVDLAIGFNSISSEYAYVVENILHIAILVDNIYNNINLTRCAS